MSFKHGKDTVILAAAYDLSSYFHSSSPTSPVDQADTTTYGKEDKTYVPGLGDGTLPLTGLFEAATADAILEGTVQSVAGEAMTWAPEGLAVGAQLRTLLARTAAYQLSAPVGDMVAAAFNVQASGGIDTGVSLHPLTAETATGNGTSDDHGAASSNGGVATIHCTAASGTSPTLDAKVQHSPNDSTWADLATFTQLTAAGSERVEVAEGTSVDRYLREVHTIGGTTPSFTAHTNFARR